MGRLIDAGKFLNNLSGMLKNMEDYDAVRKVINNMPTAYDVDKVVEQLQQECDYSYTDFEDYAKTHELASDDEYHYLGLQRAIEIVKAGGKNE